MNFPGSNVKVVVITKSTRRGLIDALKKQTRIIGTGNIILEINLHHYEGLLWTVVKLLGWK